DLARGSFFVPEMRQGETQNFAPRSTLVREHIKNVIRSYSGGNNLIFKVSNLCPLSRGVHQKGLILAAVALLHRCHDPVSVGAGLQMTFGDAKKIFTDHIWILLRIGAQHVKVNLLIE